MSDYKVGYKRPPKEYQIGQPLGPKPGITKATREKQIANATKATKIREKMLDAVLKKIDNDDVDVDEVLKMIDANINRMLADTENRGFGMPTQQVDQTSSDGSIQPTKIIVQGVKAESQDE